MTSLHETTQDESDLKSKDFTNMGKSAFTHDSVRIPREICDGCTCRVCGFSNT